MKFNGLEIFDITVNEDDIGVMKTSLVDLPAIESNFLHFNEDNPQFNFINEEKREIIGAVMIPNKPIYRSINEHKFYVNFTSEVIRQLTSKMISSGTAGLFTIQHKFDVINEGVVVQEIWIKESETDKSVGFGIDEPLGTAFMKVKVNDDVIWNQVKKSGLNGFSIELDASIIEKSELLFINQNEEVKMNIKDVFKNSIEVNGKALHFNSDLKKHTYLVSEGAEGEAVAYTGEFTLDSVIYKVEDGVVLETENVELSTKESIENLSQEFSTLKETLDSILLSKQAIEDKEAELELLKEQFAKEKEDFAKAKTVAKTKVSINLSKQIADYGTSTKDWLNKF